MTWVWISVCLLHSAFFSGLNLGFFGLSRLRLEVQADTNNQDAKRILELRKDAHRLLTTLLWGNVASNVLLTLLTESVLTGVSAFMFSTFGITFFGEIFPQAYLAKHVLKASSFLVPIVKFYQILLYPLAKPTGMLLDLWLGKEEISYFKEKEFMSMLRRHGQAESSDLARMESVGAMNFLALDDVRILNEGEVVNPKSIIALQVKQNGLPKFPVFDSEEPDEDPFIQNIQASKEKWVIITDEEGEPVLVLNAHQFLRDIAYEDSVKSLYMYCHRPIVVRDPKTLLGEVILKFKVRAEHVEDDVVDNDIILYWGRKQKRIITGADILGRLLRGIVKQVHTEVP